MAKEKTKAGKILQSIAKSAIPILLNIFLERQKFNKTPKDEKRIDDFTGSL